MGLIVGERVETDATRGPALALWRDNVSPTDAPERDSVTEELR